jgi:hypothetical protein
VGFIGRKVTSMAVISLKCKEASKDGECFYGLGDKATNE